MTPPFVMVAPTGARRSKADHPALPITLPEIVATAAACHKAGADALHLHVRDDQGLHSLDAGRYREAIAELTAQVPTMQCQITTEAAGMFDVPQQLACLEAVEPDWASVSIREIARAPDLAPRLYALCADQGTRVQHIIYNANDLNLLHHWQDNEIVQPMQTDVILVLGRYGDIRPSNPRDLSDWSNQLRASDHAMVCAFGQAEHDCLIAGAKRGFGIRVGFENSLTNAQGVAHHDNAASVTALIDRLERKAA